MALAAWVWRGLGNDACSNSCQGTDATVSPSSHAHLSVVPAVSSDDALLAQVRRGDTAAANALVRRAGPRVKAGIRRLLRGWASEADDLLQVALIELVKTIDRFEGHCSLDTWIDRVTAHVVYKFLRKQKLERRLFEGMTEEAESVKSCTTADRRALTTSALERIASRLSHLDAEKVAAWVLFDVHGFTLEELAQTLDVSAAAAQSRVSRARRDVRAALESDEELMGLLPTLEMPS